MKPDSIQLWIPYFLQMSSLISKSRCQKVNKNTSEKKQFLNCKVSHELIAVCLFHQENIFLGVGKQQRVYFQISGHFFSSQPENANFATLKNQKHKNLTYSLIRSLFSTGETLQPNCHSIAISMATAQMNVTFYSSNSIDIYSQYSR